MKPPAVAPKKLRERLLIDTFLYVCPDFTGAEFELYDENPDLIYRFEGEQIGFESIVVNVGDSEIGCVFHADSCELTLPLAETADQLDAIQRQLTERMFDHLRLYKLPTVIVFSLAARYRLEAVATHFRLPEFNQHNIIDYYICDGQRSVKLAETAYNKV